MMVRDKYQLLSLQVNETHFLFRGSVHSFHSSIYAVRVRHAVEMLGKQFKAQESRTGVIIRRTA